jgi:2-polyprenyl-3-methyl-5-hydroxy-6-metoxy-1,4-benzoquinol methylase
LEKIVKNLKEKMQEIYSKSLPDNIPWNIRIPPKQLVELIESGKITPCTAVDLGCGAGNYSIWLAKKGFLVTGIDFSDKAVELASMQAEREKLKCNFIVGDLTDINFKPNLKFKFAFDWELLHHIFPEDRYTYFQNVASLLQKGGSYFSVCFSEKDPDFGGTGKYRKTPMGTTLYFSSDEEIEELLVDHFEIEYLATSEIAGKYGPHMAVVAFGYKK